MKLKFLNIHLLQIFIITFYSCLALGFNFNIGDGYWTPLRALYILKIPDLEITNRASEFILSTFHNDSFKLFPSIIESIFFNIKGYWDPYISISIGLISWIICYYLIVRLIKINLVLNKGESHILFTFITLSMFSPLDFFYRFTTVFAIHRTLPALCVLVITNLLFNKESLLSKSKLTSFIILFSIISQLSFSNGFTIWLLTFAILMLNKKYKFININRINIKYYLLSGIVCNILYIQFFDFSHITGLANSVSVNYLKINNILPYLNNSVTFTSNYMTSFRSDSFINKTFTNSSLIIIYILIAYKYIKYEKNNFYSKNIGNLLPFVFINTFYLLPIIANFFARNNASSPPRYFVESSLFSISLVIIFFMKARYIGQIKLSYLLLYYVSFLALLNIPSLPIYLQSQGYLANRNERSSRTVECIVKTSELSYNSLYKCNLSKDFWHFSKGRELEHPFIKIKDVENYSEKVFHVFRKN